MWSSWNPFRRRTEENTTSSVHQREASDGKENTTNSRGQGGLRLTGSNQVSGNVGMNGSANNNGDIHSNNFDSSTLASGHGNVENGSHLQSSSDDDDSYNMSVDDADRFSRRELASYQNISLRKNKTSPFAQSENVNLPRDSNVVMRNENMNKSFSGVYGPLLSSPIIPKVRRALESSAGLRSPQISSLGRGKQLGRSSSMNYGSGNPAKPTAGQVPWVRLKKRESITLADIVSGNTPQSPNTVKLAVPESRHLPAAPSFKTTPLIVTTEHSRARMVDTQTVVSALREKRKRFGGNQRDDVFAEESWMSAAKRRRQDSSQSNASSVSIPSMPESLPNLMGTPGMSLLHIENLKDQRPSTVPAMDAFVSRHQREFGLGGIMVGQRPQQQVYNHQYMQPEEQNLRHKQSGKSVLRSIQSSLSSSLRARTNLSVLQQSGLELSHLRRMPESRDSSRMSFSSDVSPHDQSFDDPQPKVSRLTPATTSDTTATTSAETPLPVKPTDTVTRPSSAQTKQKIADGVVLRKHSMSIGSTSSPARHKQIMPLNALISTSDFEQDRQKEYKSRVLDLLDEDESIGKTDTVAATLSATKPVTTLISVAAGPSAIPLSLASSAATSAAVSASLDSLNKLVQSAAGPATSSAGAMPETSATSASSLAQLLTSSNGNSLATRTTPAPPDKQSSIGGFLLSAPQSQNTGTAPTPTSGPPSTGGFKFGVSTAGALGQSTLPATAGGFQMNSSTSSLSSNPTGSQIASSVSSVPGAQQTTTAGFNFGSGPASASLASLSAFRAGEGSPSGVAQSTTLASNVGLKSDSTTNNATPNLENTPKVSAIATTATSSVATGIFSSQGAASSAGPFSLSSTLQAFAASQSKGDSPFNKPATTNSGLGQGFTVASSTSAPISSLFTSSAASTTASSGFTFNAAGSGTASAGNFTAVSTSAPAAGSLTPAKASFNFGASPATLQQPGGITFGVASTNSLPVGSGATQTGMVAITTTPAAMSFTDQPANSVFKGFAPTTPQSSAASLSGSGSQPQSLFTPALSAPVKSMFGSSTSAFAASSLTSQPPQQSFGSATTAPTFSMFGATTTAGASSNTGAFTFGQSSASAASVKPFSFGAESTQSGVPFGGTLGGSTATTSSGIFGSITSPSTAASAASSFGSGTSAFGSAAAPAFGSAATTAFGSATTTAFGSAATPAFGSAATSAFSGGAATSAFGNSSVSSPFGQTVTSPPPAYGAVNSQASSFGASTATGSQSSSIFGAPVSSSNNLFTFGAQSGQPTSSQQTSSFGSTTSQPASVFGSSTSQPASVFGANASQQISVFGSTTQQQAPAFGSAAQQQASAFGSTAQQQAPAFGSTTQQQAPAFGSTAQQQAAAFGSTAQQQAPAFGSTTQQQAAAFRSTAQQQAPAFGSTAQQQAAAFGSTAQQQAAAFGSTAQQQTSAFGSTAQQQTPAFGSSTTPQAPAFGSTMPQASAFGSSMGPFGNTPASAGSSLFGTTPMTSAFGVSSGNTAPAFGAPAQNSSTGTQAAFGSTFGMTANFGAPQNTDKPAFGTAGFNATAVSPFGPTTQSSMFGSASQNPPQNVFGSSSQNATPAFGSQPGQAAAANPFGSVGSGASGANMFNASKPSIFGATSTTQAGYNFAASQPSTFNTQSASSGFNFGQSATQPASSAGFNFGAQTPKPSFQAASPSPGGFNFAAAGSAQNFNFSATPSTPNPFNAQTPTAVPRPRAAATRRPVRRGATRR